MILEPTCGDEGIARHTCVECGAEIDQPIPATGEHTFDLHFGWFSVPGTCVDEGVYTVPCAVCGQETEYYLRDPDNHVALGDPVITTPPTCDRPGEQYRECSGCGVYIWETVPALGHDYGAPVYECLRYNKSA